MDANFCQQNLEDTFNHYGKNFYLKRIYVKPEEFLRKLKTVDKITIAAKTDLVGRTSDLFQPVNDIFAYNTPEKYLITANFNESISDKILKLFHKLLSQKEKGLLTKFVCAGKNEDSLEIVFNAENLTQKIVVNVQKQQNGLYKTEDVHNKIIQQLEKLKKETT